MKCWPRARTRPRGCFGKRAKGGMRPNSCAGAHFNQRHPRPDKTPAMEDSALCDPLRAIGFDQAAMARILVRFPVQQVQLWTDVTLAAMESKGPSFFRRSPQAFFMDNIQNAVRGQRTPPEWFWDLRKQEQQRRADRARQVRSKARAANGRGTPRRVSLTESCLGSRPDPGGVDLGVVWLLSCGRTSRVRGDEKRPTLRPAGPPDMFLPGDKVASTAREKSPVIHRQFPLFNRYFFVTVLCTAVRR